MSDSGTPKGTSILLVGYGNTSRRDDGVALHIVRRLSRRLSNGPAQSDQAGGGETAGIVGATEGELTDSDIVLDKGLRAVILHQLAPELAETLAEHDMVVFIDAHTEGAGWDPVRWERVEPAYRSGLVGHHLKPSTVLALSESLYGHSPHAYILSVLGTDFDFGEELSAGTSARADEAVERLLGAVREARE